MKKIFVFILISVSYVISLSGQDIKVSAAFDSSKIYIGDQVKFSVTIEKPGNLKVSIPVLRDTICKNIEILSGPVTDSISISNNNVRIKQQYIVTSFDSGYYQIHPVYVETKNQNGIQRYFSDYSSLEVLKVKIAPPDSTQTIYDIIKPYRAPLTVGEILPWILVLLLIILIVFIIIRLIKKYKKPKGTEILPANTEPAHIIAFRELEKLKEEQLWQNGEIKLYYTRLTDILRQYIENRYSVNSLELTTNETLDALLKSGVKRDESFDVLKNVLFGADLVKFAKYSPIPSENEVHFQNSWNFVETTKINEPVESNTNESNIETEEKK
jgi:hypothetical protein